MVAQLRCRPRPPRPAGSCGPDICRLLCYLTGVTRAPGVGIRALWPRAEPSWPREWRPCHPVAQCDARGGSDSQQEFGETPTRTVLSRATRDVLTEEAAGPSAARAPPAPVSSEQLWWLMVTVAVSPRLPSGPRWQQGLWHLLCGFSSAHCTFFFKNFKKTGGTFPAVKNSVTARCPSRTSARSSARRALRELRRHLRAQGQA